STTGFIRSRSSSAMSGDRRPEHVVDMRRARSEHHQPVEAQGNTGAFGHAVRERGEEILIDRIGLAIKRALFRLIGFEAPALLGGIGQLAEGIGELKPANIKLE